MNRAFLDNCDGCAMRGNRGCSIREIQCCVFGHLYFALREDRVRAGCLSDPAQPKRGLWRRSRGMRKKPTCVWRNHRRFGNCRPHPTKLRDQFSAAPVYRAQDCRGNDHRRARPEPFRYLPRHHGKVQHDRRWRRGIGAYADNTGGAVVWNYYGTTGNLITLAGGSNNAYGVRLANVRFIGPSQLGVTPRSGHGFFASPGAGSW